MSRLNEIIATDILSWNVEYRVHASKRMFQREIEEDDIMFVLTHGQIIERYEEDFPFPSVLISGPTSASRPLHVVIGLNISEKILYIITTYEPDRNKWAYNFTRRL
jgi:hypothetical protein